MAKRKRSGRAPQARHAKKSRLSRHDKRARLQRRNPRRKRTQSAKVPLVGQIAGFVQTMATLLDARTSFRLPIVLAGAMLATSRRTASRWFRAAGVADDWDRFYDLLVAVGKQAASLMRPLLMCLVERFDPGPGGYWKLAMDDSPTKRYGRHVEAANVHRNPTPGPVGGPWLYGHNWVCLALLMKHSLWGVLALPVLSKLYVRQKDIQQLNARHPWEFRTKHELALHLARQVMGCLRALGSQAGFTIVVDGAYVARALLRALIGDGARIISRLRRDAQLFDLPPERTGLRGRPRIYGKNRISLAKRAG
ncbi:MAG: Transposase domain protein, partial [Pseudomonadota bacterium]|nr:Transposase domain protein [Pseudomonadota bacterium]